jgi:hypothetical protein
MTDDELRQKAENIVGYFHARDDPWPVLAERLKEKVAERQLGQEMLRTACADAEQAIRWAKAYGCVELDENDPDELLTAWAILYFSTARDQCELLVRALRKDNP